MSNFTDFFPAASGGGGGSIPKYQEFTSSGTFTPTQALIDAGGRVAYMIVGGGEKGQTYSGRKTGGAGGQVKIGYATLTSTTGCTVTIGAGGSSTSGEDGGASSVAFSSAGGTDITANGGSGEARPSNGSNYGGWQYTNNSLYHAASASPGILGYGGGGTGYENSSIYSPGVYTGLANTGQGSAYNRSAGSGFVRITWFE